MHDVHGHTEYLSEYLKPLSNENDLRDLYNFPIYGPLKKYSNYVGKDNIPSWVAELAQQSEDILKDQSSTTLELRNKIPGEINNADEVQRLRIAEWIVKEWGGIPLGNNLAAYLKRAEASSSEGKGEFEFERIASWSKFMAFKYPDKYAIYDARVIYSVNWLLFCNGSNKFLPPLEGRNSVMGLLDYKLRLLLTCHKKQDIETKLVDRQGSKSHFLSDLEKTVFVEKRYAFSSYCNLLRDVANKIFPNEKMGLTKVEMILFSIADRHIAIDVLKKWST